RFSRVHKFSRSRIENLADSISGYRVLGRDARKYLGKVKGAVDARRNSEHPLCQITRICLSAALIPPSEHNQLSPFRGGGISQQREGEDHANVREVDDCGCARRRRAVRRHRGGGGSRRTGRSGPGAATRVLPAAAGLLPAAAGLLSGASLPGAAARALLRAGGGCGCAAAVLRPALAV